MNFSTICLKLVEGVESQFDSPLFTNKTKELMMNNTENQKQEMTEAELELCNGGLTSLGGFRSLGRVAAGAAIRSAIK